jgi:hypothetical protein
LEQIKYVIRTMPTKTEINGRNRALIAFTLLTGARDGTIASMRLKHVDLIAGYVHQDARDVRTKFSKTFNTYFFPVGDEALPIVEAWVSYLREEKLWGNDDPLFPATRISLGTTRQFEVSGLDRAHWNSASPIRSIFRDAFVGAGLPYFQPHSFRNTLVRLGQDLCKSPEEFKAWSQNFGHEKVLTTFVSYGAVARDRQGRSYETWPLRNSRCNRCESNCGGTVREIPPFWVGCACHMIKCQASRVVSLKMPHSWCGPPQDPPISALGWLVLPSLWFSGTPALYCKQATTGWMCVSNLAGWRRTKLKETKEKTTRSSEWRVRSSFWARDHCRSSD